MKENKNQREKRRESKKEKGITLVALVVTIIILLILAGVTLSGALSENGLFQRAKRATNEYKKAEEEETKAIDEIGEEIDRITFDYNDYVGAYVEGYKPTNGSCTINATASGWNEFKGSNATEEQKTAAQEANPNIDASTGDQTFETEKDMGWRIWDYNKSTNAIRLISDKPTSEKLTLYGANGYNNGVWAINEICRKCYGKEDEPGIEVANLRRTDIQKVSTYDYTKYKHKNSNDNDNWQEVTDENEETENTIQFGATKTYETSHSYPKMWGEYDKDWPYEYKDDKGTGGDKECASWEKEYEGTGTMTGTEETETTFKQSHYAHDYKEEKNEFIKNKYYDLLFKNEGGTDYLRETYWLAGRYVHLFLTKVRFWFTVCGRK